jgi:peptidoglycan L-alanyl-D-glutamate endopeptidase CwlK
MKGQDKLKGVNQKLIDLVTQLDVITQAEDNVEITVAEGLRSKERQQQLFNEKKSKTLNSKHLTGDAIDIYPILKSKPGSIYWDFYPVLIKKAKQINSTDFIFGFDWGWDSPHIELKKLN